MILQMILQVLLQVHEPKYIDNDYHGIYVYMHPHEHQYCVSCSRSSTVGASKQYWSNCSKLSHAMQAWLKSVMDSKSSMKLLLVVLCVKLTLVVSVVLFTQDDRKKTSQTKTWLESSHVKSIGFKWPAWNSGTFRGVRYFLTIVGLPTGRKPLFYLPGCCKAQLKWTANINIEYLIEISHCTP